jgi:nucleoside-diphosphate-sugar epimerase
MTNSLATQRLLAHLSRDQKIIYASTTSLYGNCGTFCDETSPVKPVSLYGITKHEAERMVMEHENAISLRFATIFGVSPRMRMDLLPHDFTYRAMSERCLVLFEYHARRTFLHIQDAIVGYLLALDNFEIMKSNIFNVGENTLNFSKLEIADTIKKYVHFEIIIANIEDPDARNFETDFGKIKRLGYSVSLNLDDGIKELVKLYGFYIPMHSAKNM